MSMSESVEEMVERVMVPYWVKRGDGSAATGELASVLKREINIREAAIRAECEAEIKALTQKVKELKFCVDDAAPRRESLERTIVERNATIDALRDRITELEIRLAGAEPKADPELLATARVIYAARVAAGTSIGEIEDAIKDARALYAACKEVKP